MNKLYPAPALLVSVILSLTGALLLNRLVAVQPAATAQTSNEAEARKWEYCAVTDVAYFSNEGRPYYRVTIIYSYDPKNRVEVKVPFPEDPLLSMISRLGMERWEMVGQSARDSSGYNSNYLYFKRPAK